jgi:phage-related protein
MVKGNHKKPGHKKNHKGLFGGIGHGLSSVAHTILSIPKGVIGGFRDVTSGVGQGIKNITSGIGHGLENVTSGVKSVGEGLGKFETSVGSGVGTGVAAISTGVGSGVQSIGGGLGKFLGSPLLLIALIAVAIGAIFILPKILK